MSSASRWIAYQRERFPVFGNGALILAFSSGAVCYSAQLRATRAGVLSSVAPLSLCVAFISCFLFFFQLRVADEHKDLEDDARWRPYRPVPRGLVTLAELRALAFVAMGIQAVLAVYAAPALLAVLLLVWSYMWFMTYEFGVRNYLRARPFTTLWTHMLIIPCIDLYATACDWMIAPGVHVQFRSSLLWFLLASFLNGVVVEVGRKLRVPSDEEPGVETYSKVWGRTRAVTFWLCTMALTGIVATIAARYVNGAHVVASVLAILLVMSCIVAATFVRAPHPGHGKRLELLSGVWTIALYITIGVAPFLLAHRS